MAELEQDMEDASYALTYYLERREDILPRRLWNEIEGLFFSEFRRGFDLPTGLTQTRLTPHLIGTIEHLRTGLVNEGNTDPAIDFGYSFALLLSAIRRHKPAILMLRIGQEKFTDLVLQALSDKRDFLALFQKRIR